MPDQAFENIKRMLTGQPLSENYRPSYSGIPAWFGYGLGGRMFDLAAVELMMYDPTIALGIHMIEAPVITSEGNWNISADTEEIAAFVDETLRRFWRNSIRHALSCVPYGYSASEVIYTTGDDGVVKFNYLKPLHPRDVVVLRKHGEFAGIRIKRNSGSPLSVLRSSQGEDGTHPFKDLWTVQGPIPAKGFWVRSGSQYDFFYGRSRLQSSWSPWRDKTSQDGALDIIRMWYYKNAFSGARVFHPEKDIPDGQGGYMPARDWARQIGEWIKAGASMAIPSTIDPRSGQPYWKVEDPHMNGNADGLLEYLRFLDQQILRGMLIPDNVITEATGSGSLSGRKVPEDAFYCMEEAILHEVIVAADDQFIRPTVRLNFGPGAKYKIILHPMLPSRNQAAAQAQIGQNAPQPNGGGRRIPGPEDIANQQAQQTAPDAEPQSVDNGNRAAQVGLSVDPTAPFEEIIDNYKKADAEYKVEVIKQLFEQDSEFNTVELAVGKKISLKDAIKDFREGKSKTAEQVTAPVEEEDDAAATLLQNAAAVAGTGKGAKLTPNQLKEMQESQEAKERLKKEGVEEPEDVPAVEAAPAKPVKVKAPKEKADKSQEVKILGRTRKMALLGPKGARRLAALQQHYLKTAGTRASANALKDLPAVSPKGKPFVAPGPRTVYLDPEAEKAAIAAGKHPAPAKEEEVKVKKTPGELADEAEHNAATKALAESEAADKAAREAAQKTGGGRREEAAKEDASEAELEKLGKAAASHPFTAAHEGVDARYKDLYQKAKRLAVLEGHARSGQMSPQVQREIMEVAPGLTDTKKDKWADELGGLREKAEQQTEAVRGRFEEGQSISKRAEEFGGVASDKLPPGLAKEVNDFAEKHKPIPKTAVEQAAAPEPAPSTAVGETPDAAQAPPAQQPKPKAAGKAKESPARPAEPGTTSPMIVEPSIEKASAPAAPAAAETAATEPVAEAPAKPAKIKKPKNFELEPDQLDAANLSDQQLARLSADGRAAKPLREEAVRILKEKHGKELNENGNLRKIKEEKATEVPVHFGDEKQRQAAKELAGLADNELVDKHFEAVEGGDTAMADATKKEAIFGRGYDFNAAKPGQPMERLSPEKAKALGKAGEHYKAWRDAAKVAPPKGNATSPELPADEIKPTPEEAQEATQEALGEAQKLKPDQAIPKADQAAKQVKAQPKEPKSGPIKEIAAKKGDAYTAALIGLLIGGYMILTARSKFRKVAGFAIAGLSAYYLFYKGKAGNADLSGIEVDPKDLEVLDAEYPMARFATPEEQVDRTTKLAPGGKTGLQRPKPRATPRTPAEKMKALNRDRAMANSRKPTEKKNVTNPAERAVFQFSKDTGIHRSNEVVRANSPGWRKGEGDAWKDHPEAKISREARVAAEASEPLPLPQHEPSEAPKIQGAWDVVSRYWPEMAAKIKKIVVVAKNPKHPNMAASLTSPDTISIPEGQELSPDVLWHELVHREQVDKGHWKTKPGNDEYVALEREAHSRQGQVKHQKDFFNLLPPPSKRKS